MYAFRCPFYTIPYIKAKRNNINKSILPFTFSTGILHIAYTVYIHMISNYLLFRGLNDYRNCVFFGYPKIEKKGKCIQKMMISSIRCLILLFLSISLSLCPHLFPLRTKIYATCVCNFNFNHALSCAVIFCRETL